MPRYFVLLAMMSIIATIVVANALALLFTIPIANIVASFLVTAAIIGALVLQRCGIGPNRSLLKQYCLLYATLGPVILGLVMLQGFLDAWLGVTPGRQSLIGLALLVAILWSLVLLLPRFCFSGEERAELKARRKALRAVEKFWASRNSLRAIPSANRPRDYLSRRP